MFVMASGGEDFSLTSRNLPLSLEVRNAKEAQELHFSPASVCCANPETLLMLAAAHPCSHSQRDPGLSRDLILKAQVP